MASLERSLRIPYKTVSNVDIPTDVYLPTSLSRFKSCPVLVMIHGGAFMLGHAGMNNKDQIADCLERGWIVVAIEHRLCPGVNVLEGPMSDVRDALAWVQDGSLAEVLKKRQDLDWKGEVEAGRVMVMGTSSGGHLALCTAYNTPKPPLAILNFYGAVNFSSPFWSSPLSAMPPSFSFTRPPSEVEALKREKTTFIGGVSLEGQDSEAARSDPKARHAYAMHAIATGTVIPTIWPSYPSDLEVIDPLLNVNATWPPVCIVHGTADTMVPMQLSKNLEKRLIEEGVQVEFIEVEGEPHTFAGQMKKGSRTWDTQRGGFDFLERQLEVSHSA